MAVQPNPIIDREALFLINDKDVTYKVYTYDVAKNIADIIINGDQIQPDPDEPLIDLGDLGKIRTDLYISNWDRDTGAPSVVSAFGDSGMLTDINDDEGGTNNHYWLLQWVNTTVSGPHDTRGEFVLRDPEEVFAEISDRLIKNIELNSLNDVTTRTGPGKADHLPHEKDDTFLLLTTASNDPAVYTEYTPNSLREVISRKVHDREIIINIDDIDNVNPIQPPDLNGDEDAPGRLEINVTTDPKWYPGADKPNDPKDFIPKYQLAANQVLQSDDILVYLKEPTKDIVACPAHWTKPGWFYVESRFGDILDIAGSPTENDLADKNANTTITLGGVRVTQFRDTELVDDGKGGLKIGVVGTHPSNIGITDKGILFSRLPNIMKFVTVINVDTAEKETFNNGSDVPAEGPGDRVKPEDWNNPDSLPEPGDFYVMAFTGGINAQDTHTVVWNNSYPIGAVQPGPDLITRDGDIVAFGDGQWSIVGRVDTDSVQQNLQSVTEVGNTTTDSVVIGRDTPVQASELADLSTMKDGIVYAYGGRVKGATLSGQEPWSPVEGDLHGKRLSVDDIDFDGFPLLEPTTGP